MKSVLLTAGVIAASAVLAGANPTYAADKWWPVKVYDHSSGKDVVTEYSPLEKASKRWNICVLFPHMKDTFWVAVDYGVIEEAKRMGVNMTLYQAGGYENLPKQLSQFDDCLASNFDAVVIGPISEAGLAKEFSKGIASGKPVIVTVNPVDKAETTAKIFVDFPFMGEQTGKFVADYFKGKPAKVVAFPGPPGSGWAESYATGFKTGIKGSTVDLLSEKFGDSGVAVQLGLIQNALQAYPNMTLIWGCAPAAEAAIGAVAQSGRKNVLIMSEYENQAMLNALNNGEILGFATQYPVLEGRIAIDMAVRALEHKPVDKFLLTIPEVITKDNISKINMSLVLAPADFKAEYSVKE